MSALEDLLAVLRQAVSQAQAARADVSAALDQWDQRGSVLEWWLTGTVDPEALDVLANHRTTADELRTTWQQVGAAVEGIERYIHDLEGAAPSGAAPGGGGEHGDASPAPPKQLPPVTSSDGSQYPAEAAWVADMMPRRVREGQQGGKTYGFVNGSLSDQFTSGADGTWSPYVEERMQRLGVKADTAKFFSRHVEMKVAAMMIQRGQQQSEVVINHVPCGSQPHHRSPGCHQALERFLPKGHTLTVHGTTQQGKPYSHTYRGKA